MHLERHFDVSCPPERAAGAVARDETLVELFPDTRSEIVESDGNLRTVRSHYTALGQEGTATFHFVYEEDGSIEFEKVCDGRVWSALTGCVRFEARGRGTRVHIEMDGRTKGMVPEFTIRGPLRDQIEKMAAALQDRIEQAG